MSRRYQWTDQEVDSSNRIAAAHHIQSLRPPCNNNTIPSLNGVVHTCRYQVFVSRNVYTCNWM